MADDGYGWDKPLGNNPEGEESVLVKFNYLISTLY